MLGSRPNTIKGVRRWSYSAGQKRMEGRFQGHQLATLGTLDTFAISWFFTGEVEEPAGSIAGFEIVTKIAWYL